MQRLYYALDLHDDQALIAEYEHWHRPENIWPEIVHSLQAAGVRDLEIFRAGNRLVLILTVSADFSPERKAAADAADPKVQAWEALMWQFQQPLPFANPGEKWVPMRRLFSLDAAAQHHAGAP
jgi:L-rhamnose mutarotase